MGRSDQLKKITVHTDGACQGNPGPGGWAAVLRYQNHAREIGGGEPATTNNRMELQAAIAALGALKEPCEIDFYTDSQYLRRGMQEWLALWKTKGWRTTERKPLRNKDLWQQLDQLVKRHRIQWHWLKGHAGDPDNERCDRLATAEITKIYQKHTPEQLAAFRDQFTSTQRS